ITVLFIICIAHMLSVIDGSVIVDGSAAFVFLLFFFFDDTATTEIYTLSLHDALPISADPDGRRHLGRARPPGARVRGGPPGGRRSEEHTSELQSRENLVCRLLLEKKKKTNKNGGRHESMECASEDSGTRPARACARG